MNACLNRILAIATLLIGVSVSTAWAQWQLDGGVVCDATNMQSQPVAASDGMGGYIVAWEDTRSGISDI